MYRYSTRDVHCYLRLPKKCSGRCPCSKFFFYKTIKGLINLQQTVTKKKRIKFKQYKSVSLLFSFCKKKCTGRLAASLAFHAQNFGSVMEKNVAPKFTNRLSWTLHKLCKYKAFLSAKFSRICTESKDIYGKICIRENRYVCIFYPV